MARAENRTLPECPIGSCSGGDEISGEDEEIAETLRKEALFEGSNTLDDELLNATSTNNNQNNERKLEINTIDKLLNHGAGIMMRKEYI